MKIASRYFTAGSAARSTVRSIVQGALKPTLTLAASIAVVAAGGFAMPAFAQGIGVSIGINQPGVYGRIDLGNYPQPVLVNPQPVVIEHGPIVAQRRPIYLYVPEAHQRDWRRYCGRYNACGQPVYFVQEQWVRDRYREEHMHDRDHRGPGWDRDHRGPGWDRDHRGPGWDRDHDRRDDRRDDRGPGPDRRDGHGPDRHDR